VVESHHKNCSHGVSDTVDRDGIKSTWEKRARSKQAERELYRGWVRKSTNSCQKCRRVGLHLKQRGQRRRLASERNEPSSTKPACYVYNTTACHTIRRSSGILLLLEPTAGLSRVAGAGKGAAVMLRLERQVGRDVDRAPALSSCNGVGARRRRVIRKFFARDPNDDEKPLLVGATNTKNRSGRSQTKVHLVVVFRSEVRETRQLVLADVPADLSGQRNKMSIQPIFSKSRPLALVIKRIARL